MTIFNVLTMIGGLALFLFGMNVMGTGLEKSAGGRLKAILAKLTASPFRGFFLGLGVTAIIQSSSATTVMVVGFVNSGVMSLSQAIGVIMGANVGTTVTSWILSLLGLESSNIFLKLFQPSSFTPILAVVGVVFYIFSKSGRRRDVGSILLGFSVLMFGMMTMSNALKPLASIPEFANILLLFSNPALGVLAGALLTAVIQSSSASVGILQALSTTGAVTYGTAIPIIMGQNIGTCVTAMLSSIGTSKNARRAAFVHLYFNVIGTVLFLVLFYTLKALIGFTFTENTISTVGIAIAHTSFNLLSTSLMLPFVKGLEKLAKLTVPNGEKLEIFQPLDERLFVTPSVAIDQSSKVTIEMASLSRIAISMANRQLRNYEPSIGNMIKENENKTDLYEDRLGTYLIGISSRSLSSKESRDVSMLLHVIGDFERIADYAVSIEESAREFHEKNITFSDAAWSEIDTLAAAVDEVVGLTFDCFRDNDPDLAAKVEPLEQVVDFLRDTLRDRHIKRLQEGSCNIVSGFVFSDLITDFGRISDHCSNVAAAIIEIDKNSYDTHEYLRGIKSGNASFTEDYEIYMNKYRLT